MAGDPAGGQSASGPALLRSRQGANVGQRAIPGRARRRDMTTTGRLARPPLLTGKLTG